MDEVCRRQRHDSIRTQHAALTRRLRGHFNYFGVNGNARSLSALRYRVQRSWHKWLNRRSQRSRLNWVRFNALLEDYTLPKVRVYTNLWA